MESFLVASESRSSQRIGRSCSHTPGNDVVVVAGVVDGDDGEFEVLGWDGGG